MKSRKILVPVDIENPAKKINDILIPIMDDDSIFLFGLKTKKKWEYGMIVLKGGGIDENEIFSLIVNEKIKLSTAEEDSLKIIEEYLKEINKFKVGNIIYIGKSEDDKMFELKKYANRLNMKNDRKLP